MNAALPSVSPTLSDRQIVPPRSGVGLIIHLAAKIQHPQARYIGDFYYSHLQTLVMGMQKKVCALKRTVSNVLLICV